MASNPIIVFRNKEKITSDSLNYSLQEAYNAGVMEINGRIVSIGSVDVNIDDSVVLNNIVVTMPTTSFQNTDGTSMELEGVKVSIGSISVPCGVDEEVPVQVSFSKFTDTQDMFASVEDFGGETFTVYFRDNQHAGVTYDVDGDITLNLGSISHDSAGEYVFSSNASSQCLLPLLTSVRDFYLYSSSLPLPQNTVVPYGVMQQFTKNSSYKLELIYDNATRFGVSSVQQESSGESLSTLYYDAETDISPSSGLNVFLAYNYNGGVITNREVLVTLAGTPDTSKSFQYVNTLYVNDQGEITPFDQIGDQIRYRVPIENQIGTGESLLQFNLPDNTCLFWSVDNVSPNLTVEQDSYSPVLTPNSVVNIGFNNEVTVNNNSGSSVNIYQTGHRCRGTAPIVNGIFR